MIVAFDYGTKFIGVAVTDENEIFSFAKCSIPTDIYSKDSSVLLEMIPQIQSARILVVGYPANLKNKKTISTQHALDFFNQLKKQFPSKEVTLFDERFTATIALRITNLSRTKNNKKKKQQIRSEKDMKEAQILLQDYLKKVENEKNKID